MKKLFEPVKYELLILLIYLVYLPFYLPPAIHDWCATPFLITYQFGFVSRGLIGSLLALAFPFLSHKILYIVIVCSLVLLMIVSSVMTGKVIRSADASIKTITIFLVLIFCTNPGAISFLFNHVNFGRFDIYLMIITACCCMLIVGNRYLFLIPVLTVLGVLIHQGFLFLFFPSILLLLLFNYTRSKSKKIMSVTITTGIITTLTYLYIQLFGKIESLSLQELVYVVASRTDARVSKRMLEFEYFLSLKQNFIQLVLPAIWNKFYNLVIILILTSPLIYFFFFLWRNTIEKASSRKMKFIYKAMAFSFLSTAPLFLLAIDWGRWLSAIITVQFILIFSLIYLRDVAMVSSVKLLNDNYLKRPVIFILALCLLASLGKFESADMLPLSQTIASYILSFGKHYLSFL